MFADIYLFKFNNGNTRTFFDIYPKVGGIFTTQLKIWAFLC